MRVWRQKLTILLLVQMIPLFALSYLTWLVVHDLFGHEGGMSYRSALLLSLFFLLYFSLMWLRLYSRDYHYYRRGSTAIVAGSAAFALVPVLGLLFLLSIGESRPLMGELPYLGSAFASFFLGHAVQIGWIRSLSHLGYFKKNVLVIGEPGGHSAVGSVLGDAGNTKRYVGGIVPQNGAWTWNPATASASRAVNGVADIRAIILKEHVGDVLLFAAAAAPAGLLGEVIAYCRSLPISYYVAHANGAPRRASARNPIFPYVPVLESFAGPRDSLTAVSLKRLLDLAIASSALIFLMPLCLLIAAAIMLADGGPVLYVSTRIGKNGAPIRFYKFRTMVPDAEKEKDRLLPFNERADGPLFKMKNDPRVTRIGRMLRRHSLDEIPQILNVLMGSMSFVGPRPHLPEELAGYRDDDYLRLECMPGIVGLPQVSGSNTMNFRQSMSLDLAYRKDWSLAADVWIIGRTLKIVLEDFFRRRSPDNY